MDKRTLISIFLFTVALMFVNMYFDQSRQEALREEMVAKKAANLEKIRELEAFVAAGEVGREQLPWVDIQDVDGKFLTGGLLVGEQVITLGWDRKVPERVRVKEQDYTLDFQGDGIDQLVTYRLGEAEGLKVGRLPSFGEFTVVLAEFHPGKADESVTVSRGIFDDGIFVMPLLEIAKLKAATGQEDDQQLAKIPQHAIVLYKKEGRYEPVAIYHEKLPGLQYLESMAALNTVVDQKSGDLGSERFFKLEDKTQQLVFSNMGGALAEINLPFESDENGESIVQEIAFDRELVETSPANARFPSHPFQTADRKEHPPGAVGGYYPLLRRDLVLEKRNQKSLRIDPRFYALNIISESPEMGKQIFEVKSFDDKQIVFEAKMRNRTIRKTFALTAVPYCFDVTIDVEGDARGLWITSGVPEVELISGAPSPALKLRKSGSGKVEELKLPSETFTTNSEYIDWVCNSNGFFGTIMDPISPHDPGYQTQFIPGNNAPSRLLALGDDQFQAAKTPGYMMRLPLPSTGGTFKLRVLAGPFDAGLLRTIDKIFTDPATGENPNYSEARSYHGWFSFISIPFSKFLFTLMRFFHFLTGSWGLSIFLLTVALRVMLYPLNAWSMKSMAKSQKIAPKVKALQEKYKKDPKKMQLEVMNLYREEGVNPVTGCFPFLIQLPFLFGMFDLLKSTFALRGAPFIPGWIDNLAAPDVLFSWTTPIFFFGNSFHLLPFIMGGVMFVQARVMSPNNTATMTDEQRQQRAMMGTVMPVMMTLFFYNVPSGLNIYFMSTSILGIAQQYWTNKQIVK